MSSGEQWLPPGHTTPLLVGLGGLQQVGPYRLSGRLGEGGMGVVHLGLDPSGRAVAVKVLRDHIAYDPQARARLAREVSTLRRVQHPLVAEIVDADVQDAQPYLVTRYVPGPSLDAVVREHGPLSPPQLVRLGRGLSDALQAIHGAAVVHRDLKPANVLMLDGDPVVIDFGIAHVMDDVRLTSTGLVMGTPGYLSPEVVGGGVVSRATDWWGWAATVAFAASGVPPFGRGPMDVVIARVCRGEDDLSRVDPRLRPLLAAALAVNPDRRPDTPEILAALGRYAAGDVAIGTVPMGAVATRPDGMPSCTVPSLITAQPAATAQTLITAQPPAAAQPPVMAEPLVMVQPPATSRLPSMTQPPSMVRPPSVPPPPAAAVGVGAFPKAPLGRRSDHSGQRSGSAAGVLLGVLVLLVGMAALVPVITAAVALVGVVLARTVDHHQSASARRRRAYGPRRSDLVVASMSMPWHLTLSILATVVASVLPLLVGAAAAITTGGARGGQLTPGSVTGLTAAALGVLLASWWGPGGAAVRRGARALVRSAVPSSLRWVVALLVATVGALTVVGAWQVDDPQWVPLAPPSSGMAPELPSWARR
ncbi:MAG: serine/threonine-protein kinase [Angustibacter sp.]